MRILDFKRSRSPKGRGSSASVRGVQQKWYDPAKRLYYKLDSNGSHEGLVEVVVSAILDNVLINGEQFPHVHYWLEDLNGTTVCVSDSFLQKGEREISFESIITLSEELSNLEGDCSIPVDERILRIVQTIGVTFNLPVVFPMYGAMMLLDQLVFNEDRHWGNASIVRGNNGYRVAPIFDNGRAFKVPASVENPWDAFEPNPYNGDQLDAIPSLLVNTRLQLFQSDIDFDLLRLGLYEHYPETLVDGYLSIAVKLLSNHKSMRFAEYLEVL